MTQQRIRIAAIWAISCWPALNFIAANWEEVLRGGFSCIAGVVVIATGLGSFGHILFRVTWRLRRDDIVVLWTAAISLCFGYLTVRNGFLFLFTRARLELPPSAGWFVVAAVAMYLAWHWHRIARLQTAAIAFSLVGGFSATIMFVATAISGVRTAVDGPVEITRVSHSNRAGSRPNVYYIILDGYTDTRSLKEALYFDNAEFLQRMVARGFRDLGTGHSNYLRTVQTLGGIFSLEYPLTEDPRTWKDRSRIYPSQFDGVRPPPLIARLHSGGYATWFSSSIISGCPSRHVLCIGSTVAVDGAYMTLAFLNPTPLGRLLMQVVNVRRNALEPLGRHLETMLSERQPMFVFAHHLAPHPPFSLDRNCNSRHPGQEILDAWRAKDRDGYLEGLQCVNTQVERLIDRIMAADPGALIVLQSDHGSGLLMDWDSPMASWTEAAVSERASYLNLVRSPPTCLQWLDQPLGQINTARFVIGCVAGREPEYLEEHTYISTYALGPEQDVVQEWRPRSK